MISRRHRPVLLLVAVLVLALPAAASAAIGATQITSPTDPAYRVYDATLGSGAAANRLVVAGTASSTAPASDRVDIRCYWTDSGGALRANDVALGLPLTPAGAFGATVDPSTLSFNGFGTGTADDAPGVQTCRLRATPSSSLAAVDTSRLPDDAGPWIDVGRFATATTPVNGGGNVVSGYTMGAGGLRGQAQWSSTAGCGPYAFRPFVTPASFTPALFPNWDCVLAILTPGAGDARSQLVVDGRDAFTGASTPSLDYGAGPAKPRGATGISVSWRRDPATGTVTTVETSPVVRCTTATFPPTAQSCPAVVPTGVSLDRVTTLAEDGLAAQVVDTLRSIDGAAHDVDLELQDYVVYDDEPAFRFPGEDLASVHGPGDQPGLGAAGPGVVLARDAVIPDTVRIGSGTETWSQRPDDVRFFGADSQYLERYLRTVPAGGATALTHVFREGRTSGEALAGATRDADGLQGPVVGIDAPGDGAVLASGDVTATGSASDNVGVASLTLDGAGVALGPDGRWSAPLHLPVGTSTLTAVATDAAGNRAEVDVAVTVLPPPATVTPRGVLPAGRCAIPRISRSSLYGTTRSKLKRAGCAIGRVTHVRSYVRRGRVVSIAPGGGRTVALGTKVAIRLSDGKGRKPKPASSKHATSTKTATSSTKKKATTAKTRSAAGTAPASAKTRSAAGTASASMDRRSAAGTSPARATPPHHAAR